MTAPLPRCAWCGGSLGREPRWLVQTALPGAPTVGWHMDEPDCMASDPLGWQYDKRHDARTLIDGVLKRGKDRVRAGKMFWQTRGMR